MARIRSIKPELWVMSQDKVWPASCYLYLIKEAQTGPVKIGVANHPTRRMGSLQGGNSRHLNLQAVFAGERSECFWVEKAVLSAFRSSIIRGEWIAESVSAVVAVVQQYAEKEATV